MKDLVHYPLTEKSLYRFKNCFDANKSPKNIQNIRWQFFKNTESNCFVNIAFDEKKDKTAAIYAASCVKFKINDNLYLGTQSLDTITDINYRGKGLFTTLAKDVYQNAKNENVALVYGFPNGNSIYGFKKKLEWEVLDPVPFMIKPLKSGYFTNRIPFLKFFPNINLSFKKFNGTKKYLIKESLSFPKEVDNLWNIFSKNIKISVNRDKDYLDWRYLKKPNENYKIVHCYSTDGRLLGYVVFCVKHKHEGRIAYIMELIYDLKDSKAADHLLNYAITKIKKEDADLILIWCMDHSPNYKNFKKLNFFKLPEKLRPIELHFGVRVFDEKLKDIIYNRKNWYLSYSDSDTV